MTRRALILVGGLGTRLRQVVPDLPKPMAPVAGRPFLEIVLSSLLAKGFTQATLAVGYQAHKIQQHFGSQFESIALEYCAESTPLGTGGAIRHGLQSMPSDLGPVHVLNGDTFLDLEIDALGAVWRGNPIIVARRVPDTLRYGRLTAQGGVVASFSEKNAAGPGLINAGCYLVPCDLFRDFQRTGAFSIEADYWPLAVAARTVDCFVSQGHFIDIGVPEDFARAQTELRHLVAGSP